MRVVRWILLLPVAIAAGFVTGVLGVVLLPPIQNDYSSHGALVASALLMALVTAATLLVARAMAPSHKPWIVTGLGTVLIILNILEILNARQAIELGPSDPADRVRIAEAIGFILAAVAIIVCDLWKVKRETHMSREVLKS